MRRWACWWLLLQAAFCCVPAALAQDQDLLPDPDTFDWSRNDRPGYRYRGMLPIHQRFYDYIQAKRNTPDGLSWADRLMIRRLTALRRWPEAPRPNEFWLAFMRYQRSQPTQDLNLAQRLMLAQLRARGLAPTDSPGDELTQRLTAYLNSRPFAERNWFERTFGRVEPWLAYELAASGIDLRPTAAGPPTGVFPATPHQGLQISYTVQGATLGPPTDTLNSQGYSCLRRTTGDLAQTGTLTVSATVKQSAPYGGRIRIRVYVGRLGHHGRGDELDRMVRAQPGPDGTSQVFTVSVPIGPEDEDGSFFISLDGSYEDLKTEAVQVSAVLVKADVAAARVRAEADARWRFQVEETLRGLGYEDTPAGRELRAMRDALAGGEAGWKAFVDDRLRQLGEDPHPDAVACRNLRDALLSGNLPGGALPADGPMPGDVGGLRVGTRAVEGQVEGAANRFEPRPSVTCAVEFADLPAGSKLVVEWTRNGQIASRAESDVSDTGWASFTLRSGAGNLPDGTYVVTLTVGDRVLGRKQFAIGAALDQTGSLDDL